MVGAQSRRLRRTRTELAEFLKSRRERISPEEIGLQTSSRRRTPGLRREEVAALAGVGITWYTWLEQGRDIGVSAEFLDDVCRVLKLDAAERRHLYMLTQKRLPKEPHLTACTVPAVARDLVERLSDSPAYVFNLRWDVLVWNDAADKLFGFSRQPVETRNMLWMTFADEVLRGRLDPWEEQARQILTSFKRVYVQAPQDADLSVLTENLSRMDAAFRYWWKRPDIDGKCCGRRTFRLGGAGGAGVGGSGAGAGGAGTIELSHITMTLESDKHLRLVYYTALDEHAQAFQAWLKQ